VSTTEALATSFSGVHADLSGLAADDHLQYALLAGRALGQSLFGGTGAGEFLTLQGSTNADRGQLNVNSSTVYDWDWSLHAGGALWRWAQTVPASGGVITTALQIANNITVNNGLFIISAVDDLSTLRWTVAPGFAVSTLFFARPTYRSTSAGIQPAQAFIFAAQAQFDIQGAGSVTTTNYRALSFAPILRARNSGDQMQVTNTVGLYVGPLWNTNNALALVDFGTIRGVHCANGATVFFGQALGTERCQNYIGLDFNSITMTTVGVRAVVRSALVSNVGTNYFLLNNGGATSEFGTGGVHFNDNTPVQFGGTAFNAMDASIFWSGSTLDFFFAANADRLLMSNPNNGQILFNLVANEFTLNTTRGFSMGAVTGTLGNQFGNFVTGARTVGVAGGWADFLLTQGGNLSIGAFAMSDVSAWVINSISLAGGTGSIADLSTLVIGAMTTSNPGITVTRRSALRVTGRCQLSGSMAFPPITPAALASGNNNDWAGLLTGSASNGTRHWARIAGNVVTSVITGIDATAVQDGDSFELTNIAANAIDITNQDAASAAANRIITSTGATYTVAADETVLIRYDLTTTRWRMLAGTGT